MMPRPAFTPQLGELVEEPDGDEIDALSDQLSTLKTDEITIISHNHGRERRGERGISRRALQEAIKYGRHEEVVGPLGQRRWKCVYNGVSYITDEKKRHEITSWKSEDNRAAFGPVDYGGLVGCHVHIVLVVDHSGSMRNNDVAGYADRTQAVYETLMRELLVPHLELLTSARGAAMGSVDISLIVMNRTSRVLLNRVPIDKALCAKFEALGRESGYSHGHYVPALDELCRLLSDDVPRCVHPVVFFVSDGAPSDHIDQECDHGVHVWQADEAARRAGRVHRSGRHILQECATPRDCRQALKRRTILECQKAVRELGDKFDDRITINTIAFGDPKLDYSVLEEMAKVAQKGSFQKLGLGIMELRAALSTLSTTVTTLLTAGGSGGLTLRQPREMESKESLQVQDTRMTLADWWVYTQTDEHYTLVKKEKYDFHTRKFVSVPLHPSATAVAFSQKPFAQGAERTASRCVEVREVEDNTYVAAGYPLVGKETLFQEEMVDARFHKNVAKIHGEGNALARKFNERLAKIYPNRPDFKVCFSECWVYTVKDPQTQTGTIWILAEPRLDGRWFKWNNNAGLVADESPDGPTGICLQIPQAFSHFTYSLSEGRQLFCDCQGVWNSTDGFCLTDPAKHIRVDSRRHQRARTDKGEVGMRAFFESHICSDLCRDLGLRRFEDL